MTNYVLGFMFDANFVLLNQHGDNGIYGQIEEGYPFDLQMVKIFSEQTGLETHRDDWELTASITVEHTGTHVLVCKACGPIHKARGTLKMLDTGWEGCVSYLPWLVPMLCDSTISVALHPCFYLNEIPHKIVHTRR